ncbi:MAG: AAA family ATPase, partial [Cyanobacteriota bacterium]
MTATKGTGTTRLSFTERQRLVQQVEALPPGLALTPVGEQKAAYLAGWPQKPQNAFQLAAEIGSGRAVAVGLICGPISGGVLIVDHDGASAGPVLERVMGGDPLPPTWRWSSGRVGRWAAAFRVPDRFWPAMAGKWEERTDVESPDSKAGKLEGLELRWSGHYSVLIGAHPDTDGYRWLPDCSPAEVEMAEAPLQLIEPLLKDQQRGDPLPLLTPPSPLPSGQSLPLLEFTSRATRDFVETGGTPGQWNDDQLTHTLDLIGTEAWLHQQGHRAEPTARDAFAQHIAAARQKDSTFNSRRAWQRFEGGLKRTPTPSATDQQLRDRLAFHTREPRHSRQEAPQAVATGETPDQAAGPAAAPAAAKKPRLSPAQKLASLRELAAELLEQKAAFSDRVPLLRAKAEDLDLTLRDDELRRLIWDARRAASGANELLGPGAVLDLTPARWIWEGVIMPAALNLLIALPKVGKTSLVLAMLAAWHRGEPTFLGLPLVGTCPPVLIVGTDQPQSDWGRMLLEVGLIEADGVIRAPLIGLAHAGRPLHLSQEGIERIAAYAAAHPGLFVLIDSIAAVTGPLGIDENTAELAEPIRDLMEAVEPYGATVLAIHHASKGRAGESPTLASRGSTALPAVASQIVNLARMASGNPGATPDRRIVVKTDGRAGEPQHLLIERTADGWISHGTAESVALAQHLQKVEEDLNDRQADLLELVRERWASGERTDANAVAAAMDLGKHGSDVALRTLKQVARKGLIQSVREVGAQGRTTWFWPIGSDTQRKVPTPSRGGLSDVSEVSEVSDPFQDQMASPLTR